MYWLDNIVKPNAAPLTYATYETYIRIYLLPHLGRIKLDRLSVRDLQTWVNRIAAECQCCAQGKDRKHPGAKRRCCAVGLCCQQQLSARTLGNIRATPRPVLAHAQTEELLAHKVAAVKLRKTEQNQARQKAGSAWQDTADLVFTTRYGTPIEPRNLNRSWAARCAKAGVRTITVHDGRRSCGTLLADLDVHPRVAMRILRHARFALTMEIYTLASSKATRVALKRLGDSLDGTSSTHDEA
jgi:hypothetical protein